VNAMPAAGLMALTEGWGSWLLGYGSVQAAMMVGMFRAKASIRRLLISPVAAIPVTLGAALGISLVGPMLPGSTLGTTTLLQFVVATGISIGSGYVAGRRLGRRPVQVDLTARGTTIHGPPRGNEAKEQADRGELSLAGVPVAAADETKHFKLIGTTGTGKSTAIGQMLECALARGDRAVIADPDGGYLRRFYNAERGDVILNPFDRRSMKWDLFAEIRDDYDVDQLARSLIPDHDGGDPIWRGYGRTFFSAVTRQAHASRVRDVNELYRLLVVANRSELATLTRGTPAQPFLQPDNAKMFDSLRSVTSSAVASLQYVAKQRSPEFSIRDWIDRDRSREGGVLFIPYRAGQIAALRSTISAWMRIAIFSAMDRPEGDQRLWFVVDELDALGPIDGLKDALARVRKFGGRCVLGFQSIAQVASTYGEGEAHTIVENCGNTVIFRCSASEGGGTARFASTLIGQRQVRRRMVSRSTRDTELFGSSSFSDHVSIEPAVLDSEIEQIPDLCGYLKLASRPEWLRVRVPELKAPSVASPGTAAFVPVPPLPTAAVPPATVATASQTQLPLTLSNPPATTPEARASPVRRRSRAKSVTADPSVPKVSTQSKRTPRAQRANGGAPNAEHPRQADGRGLEP
jgi:hypothetical protein